MADPVPFPAARVPVPGAMSDPQDPFKKEMDRLIKRGEQDRDRHLASIEAVYQWALPWRHRHNETMPNAAGRINNIYDETAIGTLEDFAADMLNIFTPQKNNWCELKPMEELNPAERRMTEDDIKNMQLFLFEKMLHSNLYQALQEGYTDLGVGTMCLLVQDIDPTKPVHCEAIPATDLILIKGPYGGVSGIFRPKKYCREDIEVLWPDANMAELGAMPEDKNQAAEQQYDVTDGCWRDWSDKRDVVYKYGVIANGKLIVKRQYAGEGSCPFIVARWSRDATTAWGFGPTYRTLPAIRTLNYCRHLDLKNYDKFVDPPTSYEDDGVMNVDFVEPGTWLPRAVGSKPPEVIESMAKFDLAVFERDELRSTIRRAHYQDRPEQLGKTPPTATQWSDERAERARRMGTPATNLVEELQYPLVRRFMYIYQVRGTLPPIQLEGRELNLQPNSSLLRAQQEEEVVRLDKFTELITARFGPQVAMVVINTVKYAERLGELLDIDPKLLRDEAQITAAIEQMLPVLQATRGGVGAAAAGPVVPPGAEAAAAVPLV